MEFHSIANVWPMMDEEKLQELVEDIKVNGLINPIWTYEGKVLDGRNRYRACLLANIKPTLKAYTGDNPTAFAVSLNDRRRHMNKGALAAVAVELLPFFEEDARKRKSANGGDRKSEKVKSEVEFFPPPIATGIKMQSIEIGSQVHHSKARDEAAKSVGVNERYIQDAKKVKNEAPEVFERMKAGKITLQDAKREVAKKPTDDWRHDERYRQSQVEKGICVTANQSKDKNLIQWAESKSLAVRIDRSSKYGNPFILGQDGSRDEVCDAFELYYLPHKPSILADMNNLGGKVLVCHCHPERCHGDCLAEKANARGKNK